LAPDRALDMPDVWQSDKLILFLAYFIPGFIALEVYGLFVSTDNGDIAKKLPAVVAYSAIHYAFTGWLILIAPAGSWRLVAAYIVVLFLPILWPPLILLARDPVRWKPVILTSKLWSALLSAEASPWDRVFINQSRWVKIKLKDGVRIGGFLGPGSIVSSYPSPEQLFISNAYFISEDGAFGAAVTPQTGLLVSGTEISTIEIIN
jgi:hypothetical protein